MRDTFFFCFGLAPLGRGGLIWLGSLCLTLTQSEPPKQHPTLIASKSVSNKNNGPVLKASWLTTRLKVS